MKIIRHPLFMRPTPESELEQAIDRELRRLPDLRAPRELLPRVLQAIAEREKLPWWQKSFAYWPWPARVLFLAATAGLAAVLVYFTWGVSAGVSFGALTEELGPVAGRFEQVRGLLATLGGAAVTLGRAAGPWFLWGAAGVLGACYLTTVALGAFCWRLAAQKI